MQEQAVYGYEFEGTRYDCGTTMGWLKASVELALAATRARPGIPGVPPGPGAVGGRPDPRAGPDLNGQWVRFGFGPSGEWFGLQKKPGFATCGSWIPSLTSWP